MSPAILYALQQSSLPALSYSIDPTLIEDPAPYTVEIGRYQKYGELLKNSVESYPLRDKILLVMKDLVWVEQALAMGAIVKTSLKG